MKAQIQKESFIQRTTKRKLHVWRARDEKTGKVIATSNLRRIVEARSRKLGFQPEREMPKCASHDFYGAD